MQLIENYPITKGVHCASTSLSEIFRYYNYNLSEAMVFGISSGLDFVYYDHYLLDYSRLVFARNPVMENTLFTNLGLDFKWQYGDEFNWDEVKRNLDKKIPVLFLTDPYYLEFFNVKVNSAAGHTLTVIGYSEEEGILFISDSIDDKIFTCNFDSFFKSINNKKPPFYQLNIWSPVPFFTIDEPLTVIIERAMINNATAMIDSQSGHRGISAIHKLGKDIRYWDELPNWQELCTNVYRSLELIGTGGSGFRKLYQRFLHEALNVLPWLGETSLLEKIEIISQSYRKLSRKCYLAGNKDRKILSDISNILFELEFLETDFWSEIISSSNRRGK
ncbi:BtrH N-terminal domain-containing protein [Margalitia sp. FSL K6-0131]|uniref:BtrH N-terminal domain-containing protein n=1 Tax=Margalitia sp. FSL K6-0131 TaxID=2954604 RepID=UPI0030FAC508